MGSQEQSPVSSPNKTIAEVYEALKREDSAQGKPEEQIRLVAVLLANQEFAKFMFDRMRESIPPVIGNLVGKLLPPNIQPDEWWKLPIDGIWSMERGTWEAFHQFLTLVTDYMQGRNQEGGTNAEHSAES